MKSEYILGIIRDKYDELQSLALDNAEKVLGYLDSIKDESGFYDYNNRKCMIVEWDYENGRVTLKPLEPISGCDDFYEIDIDNI